MAAARFDIVVEQGATFRFPKFQFGTLLVDNAGLPILDGNGNQQIDVGRDFTGCRFRCQIRTKQRPDSDVVLTVTSEDTDGGITGDANGTVIVTVPDELTDNVWKDAFWDMKCYNPDNTEDRLIEGLVTVSLAVTADATTP